MTRGDGLLGDCTVGGRQQLQPELLCSDQGMRHLFFFLLPYAISVYPILYIYIFLIKANNERVSLHGHDKKKKVCVFRIRTASTKCGFHAEPLPDQPDDCSSKFRNDHHLDDGGKAGLQLSPFLRSDKLQFVG